jgi:hypothetical protein
MPPGKALRQDGLGWGLARRATMLGSMCWHPVQTQGPSSGADALLTHWIRAGRERSDGAGYVDAGAPEATCVAVPSCAVEGPPNSSNPGTEADNLEIEVAVSPAPVPGCRLRLSNWADRGRNRRQGAGNRLHGPMALRSLGPPPGLLYGRGCWRGLGLRSAVREPRRLMVPERGPHRPGRTVRAESPRPSRLRRAAGNWSAAQAGGAVGPSLSRPPMLAAKAPRR